MKNSVTKETSAFFEPALDYIVCKIPRWDLGKFQGVDRELGSSMKSVGEVMAIGRTFEEAIQKGLRMIGQGMHGFVENKELVIPNIDKSLHEPTDKRIFVISKAMRAGYTVDQIHELTKIDCWFLRKLMNIVRTAHDLEELDESITSAENPEKYYDLMRRAKIQGFSDFQIARAIWKEKMEDCHMQWVRQFRKSLGIVPVVKQIDTLAAEYPAQTKLSVSDLQRYRQRREIPGRPQVDCGTGLGSLPHRLLGRVRLVRRAGFEYHSQRGLPQRDDQLQPRDGINRLRHVRPALFRRADLRTGDGYSRTRKSSRRNPLDRWTDTQQPGHAPRRATREHIGYDSR